MLREAGMSAKLSPIEKLAREICWMGFSPEGRIGKTKAAYWRAISGIARKGYREDALQFAHLLKHIDVNLLNEISAS